MRAVISVVFAASLAFVALSDAVRAQDQDGLDSLNRQIETLHAEGKDAEAFPLAKRYVALVGRRYGESNPEFATAVTWLGSIHQALGQTNEAEELFKQAVQIRERVLGPDHAQVGTSLSNLAALYQSQGRQADAEPLAQRAAAIREQARGADEFETLKRQIQELQWSGKTEEALALAERYVEEVRHRYGEDHPEFATAISLLASLYQAQGRNDKALVFHERALSIREKTLPPNDPQIVGSLNVIAALLESEGRNAEAEALRGRAGEIEDRRRPAPQFRVALIPSYAVVKVYYGTDRSKTSDADPARTYGATAAS